MNSPKEVLALLPSTYKVDEYTRQHAAFLSNIYKLLVAEKKRIVKVSIEPVKYFFAKHTVWEMKSGYNSANAMEKIEKNDGFEVDGQHITVETDRATYKVKVPTGTRLEEEFCKLLDLPYTSSVIVQKPVQTITFPADVVHAIREAAAFVSKDDLRPSMQQVLLELNGQTIKVVATDAHRLYMSQEFTMEKKARKPVDYLVPATAFKKAPKLEAGAMVSMQIYSDGTFKLGNYTGVLHDGKFVQYKVVVPEYKGYVIMNRLALINAIKKVLPYSNKSTAQINFVVDDQVKLHTQDVDFSFESNSALPYLEKKVSQFHIAFNGSFLLTVLNTLQTETVKLMTDGHVTKCGIFTDGKTDILIMPLLFHESMTEEEIQDKVDQDTRETEPEAPTGQIVKTRRIVVNYLEWVYGSFKDAFVHVYSDRISIRYVSVVENKVIKGSRLLNLPAENISYLLPELHQIATRHGRKVIEKTA